MVFIMDKDPMFRISLTIVEINFPNLTSSFEFFPSLIVSQNSGNFSFHFVSRVIMRMAVLLKSKMREIDGTRIRVFHDSTQFEVQSITNT